MERNPASSWEVTKGKERREKESTKLVLVQGKKHIKHTR